MEYKTLIIDEEVQGAKSVDLTVEQLIKLIVKNIDKSVISVEIKKRHKSGELEECMTDPSQLFVDEDSVIDNEKEVFTTMSSCGDEILDDFKFKYEAKKIAVNQLRQAFETNNATMVYAIAAILRV